MIQVTISLDVASKGSRSLSLGQVKNLSHTFLVSELEFGVGIEATNLEASLKDFEFVGKHEDVKQAHWQKHELFAESYED